jgi:hypothetical protein
MLYAVSGSKAEAQKVLDRLQDPSVLSYVAPYNVAIVYAGLGNRDQTFAWLDRAYKQRSYFTCPCTSQPTHVSTVFTPMNALSTFGGASDYLNNLDCPLALLTTELPRLDLNGPPPEMDVSDLRSSLSLGPPIPSQLRIGCYATLTGRVHRATFAP